MAQESATATPTATPAATATPTGDLVVAPGVVRMGQTPLAVGLHTFPRDLEVAIRYSGHFTLEDESCDAAGTPGATPRAVAPTWVTLKACEVGDGWVRLAESETGRVIEEVSVTVIEPEATRQAATTVAVSGVASSEWEPGGSGDEFEVRVTGLEIADSYELNTVALNGSSAAFDEDCTDFSETEDIGWRPTTKEYTVYGCVATGTYIWSWVEEEDGSVVASTGLHDHRVNVADPTVSFSSSTHSVDEGDEATVTVELSYESHEFIKIPITVSNGTAESADYEVDGLSSDGELRFSPRVTSATFTIDTHKDTDAADETVNISFGTLPSIVSGTDSPSTARLTIRDNYTPTNSAPIITGGRGLVSYAENGGGPVERYTATDADGDNITWSLPDTDFATDRDDFNISSGILKFNSAPDSENPADSNEDNMTNVYRVTVRAGDGNVGFGSIDVTINVTNVDEHGAVALSTTTPVVGTAVAARLSDPDGGVEDESWQWQRSTDGVAWSDISDTTSDSYTLVIADQGHRLRASVSYDDQQGVDKSGVSAGSSAATYPPYPMLTPPTLTLGGAGESVSTTFTVPCRADLFDYSLTLLSITDGDASFRELDSASPTSTGRRAHTFSISSDSGDSFKGRLTVCRESDSGSCESTESATIHRPRPPADLTLSVNPAGSAHIEVGYTASEEPHEYVTELHGSASETGTYTLEASLTSGESSRPPFLGQTWDRWYRARTKNCIDATHTQCGLWSAFSSPFLLPPKLATPTGLDVVPMAARLARLTWIASVNADENTEYEIRIEAASNPGVWHLADTIQHPSTSHEIVLDNVFNLALVVPVIQPIQHMGLADEDHFNVNIIAEDSTATKLDSDDSKVIMIIDTPILSVNGNSSDANLGVGKAIVKWSPPSNIESVTLRYRKLLDSNAHAHTDHRWRLHEGGTLPAALDGTVQVNDLPDSDTTFQLTLILEETYAVQLNYRARGGDWTYAALMA